MYCERCGHKVKDCAVFCKKCGSKIKADLSDTNQIENTQKPVEITSTDNLDNEAAAVPNMSNKLALGSMKTKTKAVKNGYTPVSLIETAMPKMILDRSMKWFNFFVQYLIPIWLVFGTIVYINQTTEMVHDYLDGSFSAYLINSTTSGLGTFELVSQIVSFIWLIYARKALKKYSLHGFYLIILYFVFRMIYPLNSYLFVISYVEFYEVLSNVIANAIFVIPNIIYFYKRKHILSN